jgi:hypothetical protein
MVQIHSPRPFVFASDFRNLRAYPSDAFEPTSPIVTITGVMAACQGGYSRRPESRVCYSRFEH